MVRILVSPARGVEGHVERLCYPPVSPVFVTMPSRRQGQNRHCRLDYPARRVCDRGGMMAAPIDAQPSFTSPNLGARERAARFCRRFGLRVPILQAPMAGACPASLASAVANAGGMGGLGALMTAPDGIAGWAQEFRGQSNGSFQINLWTPDPEPVRDRSHEARVREFLGQWGPPVPEEAGEVRPFDFAAQCDGLLRAAPQVVSTIMGLFPENFVAELKS